MMPPGANVPSPRGSWPAEQGGSRHLRRFHFLRQIQETRLGGADRIIRDDLEPTPARYAHICEGPSGSTVHTTDSLSLVDGYARLVQGGDWRHVGSIDLETGLTADVL